MAPKKDSKGAAGKDKGGKSAKSSESADKGIMRGGKNSNASLNYTTIYANPFQVPPLAKRKRAAIRLKCVTFCVKNKAKS